jgi:hypothetical protein
MFRCSSPAVHFPTPSAQADKSVLRNRFAREDFGGANATSADDTHANGGERYDSTVRTSAVLTHSHTDTRRSCKEIAGAAGKRQSFRIDFHAAFPKRFPENFEDALEQDAALLEAHAVQASGLRRDDPT